MAQNKYANFVRPSSSLEARFYTLHSNINGEAARKMYLDEVKDVGDPESIIHDSKHEHSTVRKKRDLIKTDVSSLTDKDLFLSAQNDDVDTLKLILDASPDKINLLDDYGWSLLMIACQANSIHAVKELLVREINTSVRDKAGNSAQNLVIKNKNLILADLLITHKRNKSQENMKSNQQHEQRKVKLKEEFSCDICNKVYPDKQEHLSSTVHNISASRGRKIPANYVIPPTNKGYQLMLKEGWDRDSGLGPDGSGKRYPIKTVQKKDKKGLGLDKKKLKVVTEIDLIEKQTRRARERQNRYNKQMERKFRREFY